MCTCPSQEVAHRLAKILVESNLAACVNIIPTMISIYAWQGQLEEEPECLLLIKTLESHYEALEASIETEHPYECPEIMAFPISTGSHRYLQWISNTLS